MDEIAFRRRFFRARLKTQPLSHDLGETVEITYPRYGLDDGNPRTLREIASCRASTPKRDPPEPCMAARIAIDHFPFDNCLSSFAEITRRNVPIDQQQVCYKNRTKERGRRGNFLRWWVDLLVRRYRP